MSSKYAICAIYCYLFIAPYVQTKISSVDEFGIALNTTNVTVSNKVKGSEKFAKTSALFREKCYKSLGCVQLSPEWLHSKYRPENELPADRYAVNTVFVHWLLENENLTSKLIEDSFKIDGTKLKILIHDFTSNGYTGWIQHLSRALLMKSNTGVVSVNWMSGAEPPFVQAVANARLVALEITHFLNKLKNKCQLYPDKSVHVIGHGLGAHIGGYVGKMSKLFQITALDPTGPHFMGMPPHVRLHRDDAQFVEVVHTDIAPYGQGYADILGHVDFFPNGGRHQPGCVDMYVKLTSLRRDFLKLGETLSACSHKRSLKYYIEALIHPTCSYLGFACPTHKDFLKGKCASCGPDKKYCARLPANIKTKVNNTVGFHFVTAKSAPFCVETLKVVLVLNSKNAERSFVKGYFNVSVPQNNGDISFLLNENQNLCGDEVSSRVLQWKVSLRTGAVKAASLEGKTLQLLDDQSEGVEGSPLTYAITALNTDDLHVFMVFRSVPLELKVPCESVNIKWIQRTLRTPWSAHPKIAGLMLFKMRDVPEASSQWFCPISGSSDQPYGLSLGPCEIDAIENSERLTKLLGSVSNNFLS